MTTISITFDLKLINVSFLVILISIIKIVFVLNINDTDESGRFPNTMFHDRREAK